MVKYIGSKRLLVPSIVRIVQALPEVASVCDLFAGTTRVGQGFKRAGYRVHSNDLASYSEVLGQAYIATDSDDLDVHRLTRLIDHLNGLSSKDGYFTETFCRRSRYIQEHNGRKVDAVREEIDRLALTPSERAVLLTSLLIAADRVDSTTGLQMAYLKRWAPRSYQEMELTLPDLIPGTGHVTRLDANVLAESLSGIDLVYIDPPYNQHSYFGNYHVWETLIRNDRPEVYGVACKRVDCRETRSRYNSRVRSKDAFAHLIASLARSGIKWLLVSFNTEGYLRTGEIVEMLKTAGHVSSVGLEYKRYVGAQIGVYNPQGVKVGSPTHLKNRECLFLVGPDAEAVERALTTVKSGCKL